MKEVQSQDNRQSSLNRVGKNVLQNYELEDRTS